MTRPVSGLTTRLWMRDVPVYDIPVGSLLVTQDTREEWVQDKVTNPFSSHTDDPYGHVVVQDGRWYLEDGHHRYAAAVLMGHQFWQARVFVLSSN